MRFFKRKLVTVVIPAYNHELYVRQAIQSVIAQTHKKIELIIINDGSTDQTDREIRKMADDCTRRFSRYQYIAKANEGLAATLNLALDWARGGFMYMIASDDVARPHAVERLYRFLSGNPEYALAVGDNEIIDGAGARCYWDEHQNNVPEDEAVYGTFADFLKQRDVVLSQRFLPENYGSYETLIAGNYITNGKMYRIDALKQVGGFVPDIKLEDWYICLQLAKKFRFKFFDEVLLSYRWHNSNTIKRTSFRVEGSAQVLAYEKENHPEWYCRYLSD